MEQLTSRELTLERFNKLMDEGSCEVIGMFNDFLISQSDFNSVYQKNNNEFWDNNYTTPSETFSAIYNGSVNKYDDYINFDGYENPKSWSYSAIVEYIRGYYLLDFEGNYDPESELVQFIDDNYILLDDDNETESEEQ